MFSIETVVGRLVEVRVWESAQREQIESLAEALRAPLAEHAPVVLCFDLRGASRFDPSSATRLIERMRESDAHVERLGMLLPRADAAVVTQVDCILRLGRHSNRRAFQSLVTVAHWLDPVLTPGERTRLTAFLDRGARPRTSTAA